MLILETSCVQAIKILLFVAALAFVALTQTVYIYINIYSNPG